MCVFLPFQVWLVPVLYLINDSFVYPSLLCSFRQRIVTTTDPQAWFCISVGAFHSIVFIFPIPKPQPCLPSFPFSFLDINSTLLSYYLFVFPGVFGDDVVTVMEGDSVTLHTDITKKEHDKVLWYFEDTRIALINGRPNTSCLYDGEGGRFRDRLKVDYETGSLTITDIRSEHTGRYEAEIIRSESSGKRQSLNRNRKCDSTKITKKISITHDDTIKTFSMIVTAALSDQVRTEEPRVEKRVLSIFSPFLFFLAYNVLEYIYKCIVLNENLTL
uniref:Immunoglobulin V-set domain-containing protein n=1 Tax=Cyprinus carpio TaxID=7962 RepID=A0A8C1LII5_CYPCA